MGAEVSYGESSSYVSYCHRLGRTVNLKLMLILAEGL